MSRFWAVFRKEMRDSMRDRRSLMSALLYPLLGPVMIALMFTYIADTHDREKPLEIPVVGRDNAPALMDYLQEQGVKLKSPPADPEREVRNGDLDLVLVVPEDYGEAFRAARPAAIQLIIDDSRNESRTTIRRTRRLLQTYSQSIGSLRLLARGVHPAVVRPLDVQEIDLATPQKKAATVLGMLPMFVLLAAFIGGMYVATDTTAGERERGSLEPLLCNPVSRPALVAGKWATTTVFASVAVVLTLLLTLVALQFVPLEGLGISLEVGAGEAAGLLVATLPLAWFAAGAQMLVATFARSFKEAQTYLSLLMFVPMIPGVILSLEPVRSALWMMAVPTYGQQLLLQDVLRGEATPVLHFVVAAAVSVAGTVACLAVTARLFTRERIIFGR